MKFSSPVWLTNAQVFYHNGIFIGNYRTDPAADNGISAGYAATRIARTSSYCRPGCIHRNDLKRTNGHHRRSKNGLRGQRQRGMAG